MKLHHRMLRHFIAASVIVLTSSFLIFELVASDRAMSAYLRYIVQRADSSFLYDKGRCEQVPDMRSCLSSGAMEQGSS
ncbi:hypothetical protein G894_01596 [Escherichia coli KOEGE 73 (195a)]|nr:hypothetical protein G894_01596 [Escherichia coli KOEGE 73 (195a)]